MWPLDHNIFVERILIMPLLLDANSTFPIVLKTDEDKTRDIQPRFIARVFSKRKWKEVATLSDRFEEAAGGADVMVVVTAIFEQGLVGWENMIDPETGEEIQFSLDRAEDILTSLEAVELMQKIVAQRITLPDKKKLGSLSGSDTGKAANPV